MGQFPEPCSPAGVRSSASIPHVIHHPDNSFDVVLQTGLALPTLHCGGLTSFLAFPPLQEFFWFLALACAVGGGSAGSVQDRAELCEGRHVSVLWPCKRCPGIVWCLRFPICEIEIY